MDVSEIHLERALNEYNDTVNMLESEGGSPELVEAYVNRGCILYMMGYLTSAMEDLGSACELMEEIGIDVDAGTYVKAHATMGAILYEQGSEISEEYGYALTRLDELNPGSKHFDKAGIIRMCVESAENLLDSDYPEDAERFVMKAMSILENSFDRWSSNRKMELMTLRGECRMAMKDREGAMEQYSDAIALGTTLVEDSEIEDMEELVVPIIARSQCESELGLDDLYLSDLELAVGLLEEMLKVNKLSEPDILVDMHQQLASALMVKDRMEEAERHLMRAVSMGVHGADDYIRNQVRN
jgi:ElaB/YqjD/DUF883 family membrane-anchored ribosome-binding protein